MTEAAEASLWMRGQGAVGSSPALWPHPRTPWAEVPALKPLCHKLNICLQGLGKSQDPAMWEMDDCFLQTLGHIDHNYSSLMFSIC